MLRAATTALIAPSAASAWNCVAPPGHGRGLAAVEGGSGGGQAPLPAPQVLAADSLAATVFRHANSALQYFAAFLGCPIPGIHTLPRCSDFHSPNPVRNVGSYMWVLASRLNQLGGSKARDKSKQWGGSTWQQTTQGHRADGEFWQVWIEMECVWCCAVRSSAGWLAVVAPPLQQHRGAKESRAG